MSSSEPSPLDPLDPRNELSEFLRTRRARLQPEDVGLPYFGARRRVPGLRREELAQLAGVSAAYYTRLEQGNARNVSAAVLEAIADALRLDRAEREHLDHLAKPAPRRGRAVPPRPQRVRPQLQHLLDAMDSVPAYVLGRRCDILAWNRLACALLGDFAALPPEQRNMAWLVFMEPATRELYDDWEGKARDMVAGLRMHAGRSPDDPRLAALIGELSVKSPEFRQWWAAHDVRGTGPCTKELHHPVVGRLTLANESMVLPADPDQLLVTYAAEPGSASAEALRLLASWTAEVAQSAATAEASDNRA
ncbi:helix-turn-helix transcriptional regulator [Streptacidiphilus jiangxiensis]|uniref:Helix-turn-helix domain-containing protein n=1 Tax=Streptacidiphilus jiangxiensis TaxID=235985 RepID=A0A1H7Z4X9_STRJI|nr:helix-turn-helix transcriptional regulator [Streptacidiphilus jiangxiensis]SEM52549.1 Helix-turn-helix domain-containing protein [Streptacidiphilus jiangxiensis]